MNITHKHYTYRVTWSVEDNEYVGLCAEFPSLSWLAGTQELVRCKVDSPIGNPPFRNVGVALSDRLERIPVKINFTHFVCGGLPIGETALRIQ